MNLSGDPWIPVIDADGGKRLVSLAEAFRDGESLRDLAVNPPQRIALMRLLICIAQAALDGPDDELAWLNCRDKIADASTSYLERWRHKFELYGDEPFLQVPALNQNYNAFVDKLDFGTAAGSSSTLFDHGTIPEGRQQVSSWQALMLLTYQCFSPGGISGGGIWAGESILKFGIDAPCIAGTPLYTLIVAASLIDSIHMNMIPKDLISEFQSQCWGKPIWEHDRMALS